METNNVKLTDNEIIKAYEDCQAPDSDCMECPLKFKDCHRLILYIINRQKADLENYKQIAENQQSVSMDKEFEIKRLRAEVERLKATVDSFTDIGKMYSEVKAEAVKEFADSIERYKTGFFITGEELIIIPLCDFEEIKKEMAGEQDV